MKNKIILFLMALLTAMILFACNPKNDDEWIMEGNIIDDKATKNNIIVVDRDIDTIPSSFKDVPPDILDGEQFLGDIEAKIFDEINAERERNGLDKLYFSIELEVTARIRSKELCIADSLEHERPNGGDWSTVITEDLKLPIKYMGENLANIKSKDINRVHLSGSEWFSIWKDSPPHYELILAKRFTHMGVGIYFERTDSGYISYATTHFAEIEPPE